MGEKKMRKSLVGKPKEKRKLGTPRIMWERIILKWF
jgi:hypothetical protein